MKFIVIVAMFALSTLSYGAEKSPFAKPALVKEFRVNIPKEKIDWIIERVKQAKLPKQLPPPKGMSKWQTGADIAWLEGLRTHWLEKYKWEDAQNKLNSFPQYMAKVDGYDIHFYYVRGEGANPMPLVLTHGWPGSVVEFLDVIDKLANPSKYGGNASDAFTLIVPSLPGFGFSSAPQKAISVQTTAKLWNKLVTEIIGHKKYVAQGGDFGALVTSYLGYLFPDTVKSIHINMFAWGTPIPEEEQTPAIKKWLKESQASWEANFDYARIQINRPMVASVALNDSPIGTATWIAEKFWAWSDNKGNLESVVSKDTLLSDVMVYLVSEGGISSSFWYYRGLNDELNGKFHPGYVKVPTTLAIFPKEFVNAQPPEEAAKKVYNVVRFVKFENGGHFAALEQPEAFVKDVRESFRAYR